MGPASPNSGNRPHTASAFRTTRKWRPVRLVTRTVTKAWNDDILQESAAAAFWGTLSLPPLLLGLLGSLGYMRYWFGPDVVAAVQDKIMDIADAVFSENVVNEIIRPTVTDILTNGPTPVISVAFVLSLWAGSSALASLIDSITLAHDQYMVRNTVWQRSVALLTYLASLLFAIIMLPVIALGPSWLPTIFPRQLRDDISTLIHIFYYPATGLVLVVALATLYKVALPRKLPWHRGLPGALLAMLVFLCSSLCLRLYIAWVTSTGYTYGALAAPIAFLLFLFFIGFAVVGGAHFNNAIQEVWPAGKTSSEKRRWRRLEHKRTAQRSRTEEGYAAWSPVDTAGQQEESQRSDGATAWQDGKRGRRRGLLARTSVVGYPRALRKNGDPSGAHDGDAERSGRSRSPSSRPPHHG